MDTYPTKCPECEGTFLLWNYANEIGPDGPAQNRLNTSDIRTVVYLGCEECSETVLTLRIEDFLAPLNKAQTQRHMMDVAKTGVSRPEITFDLDQDQLDWANKSSINGLPLYMGFTERELRSALALVKNPEGWKLPHKVRLPYLLSTQQLTCIEAALLFYGCGQLSLLVGDNVRPSHPDWETLADTVIEFPGYYETTGS